MKKILVVDDETDFCQMVKRAPERGQEFEVITTINPEELFRMRYWRRRVG